MSYEKVTQAESIIVGTKQTLKALKNRDVTEVIIAQDADQRVTNQVRTFAKQNGIPVSTVDSTKKLGKVCGIEVGAATVAIKR